MVKKNWIRKITLIGAALFMIVVQSLSVTTAEAKNITITYATNTAPTGLRGIAEKMFVDEIERLSDGRLKVRAYWGQSLLKGKEILKGVKNGVCDMGHVNINYYPNRLVKNSALTLFQSGPVGYENKMWIYDTMFDTIPELTAEIESYNQKVVYKYSVLPYAGTFTAPVNTIEDFKGLRVRAASRWTLSVLGGTGATPVSIPWGDCYMALETNAIEGVFTNLDAIHRTKLDEVGSNILIFKELWLPTPYLITMNMKKWKKLPKDLQGVIEKAAQNSQEKFAALSRGMFDEIVAAQKKSGYKVAFAQKTDIEKWMNLKEVQENKTKWIEEVNEATGTTDAASILSKVEKIVSDGIKKDN